MRFNSSVKLSSLWRMKLSSAPFNSNIFDRGCVSRIGVSQEQYFGRRRKLCYLAGV